MHTFLGFFSCLARCRRKKLGLFLSVLPAAGKKIFWGCLFYFKKLLVIHISRIPKSCPVKPDFTPGVVAREIKNQEITTLVNVKIFCPQKLLTVLYYSFQFLCLSNHTYSSSRGPRHLARPRDTSPISCLYDSKLPQI